MVLLALASFFGCAAVLLLLYGILRLTQESERPLSTARRASILGGLAGLVAILALIGWWGWISPPN